MHATLVLGSILLPFTLAAPTASGLRSLKSPLWPRQDNNTCNLAELQQPTNTLTPPSADLELVLIALGRGTQNYTCANSTASPAAIGAVANLFNASCAVANNTPLGQIAEDESAIGAHFFFDNTTPEFDIIGLGETFTKKVEEVAAPQPANIKWLRLEAQQSTTGPVRQIYRLNTIGGLAPATCDGQASGGVLTVEYEAQYWIYASQESLALARAQKRAALAFKGP